MRMESTLKFIYKALFVEGRDSDVTVKVMDKEWHLHKMYLQQVCFYLFPTSLQRFRFNFCIIIYFLSVKVFASEFVEVCLILHLFVSSNGYFQHSY